MSLNPLNWLSNVFGLADKSLDIVKESVTDKDKANELIANLEELKVTAMYMAELQTKTVPWIDGLHKLGRQIINVLIVVIWLVAISMGHEFTQWDLLILGGGNVAYQLIKGKGK